MVESVCKHWTEDISSIVEDHMSFNSCYLFRIMFYSRLGSSVTVRLLDH